MTGARGKRQTVVSGRASRASQLRVVLPQRRAVTMEPVVGMASVKRERESLSPPDAERAPVKRNTCDVDLEALKCPTCTRPLSVPVYQCRNGHITCSACYLTLNKDLCVSCSTRIGKKRNTAVEKIIESVLVACKHAHYGCNTMLKYIEKKEHEAGMCKYRPFQCPVPDCTFEGTAIPQHFAKEHGAPTFIFQSGGALGGSFKFENSISKYAILEFEKELLLFHHELDEGVRDVFFCTSFGPLDNSRYNLKVGSCHDKETPKRYSTTGIAVSDNQQKEGSRMEVISRGDFLIVPRLLKPCNCYSFESDHYSIDFWFCF